MPVWFSIPESNPSAPGDEGRPSEAMVRLISELARILVTVSRAYLSEPLMRRSMEEVEIGTNSLPDLIG